MNANTTTTTSATPGPLPAMESVKRVFAQPAFLAAFVVLFVAAMSLNAATQFMKLYFKKDPVQLDRQLETIPAALGPWVQVSVDQTLSHEMLDVLGTKQYVFRDYVDSRVVPADTIAAFKDKTDHERGYLLARVQRENPAAVVRVGVTYYTGMVDTVAHIPDRCYVADGFVPDVKETPTWELRDKDGQTFRTAVTSIHFEDSTPQRGSVTRNVVYFFHCNGGFEHDAISGVRMRLQNLFERSAYYAKVEVMTEMSNRERSDATIRDFLCNLIPEVQRCLPDWEQVKARESGQQPQPQPQPQAQQRVATR